MSLYLKLLRPGDTDCPRIGQIRNKMLKAPKFIQKTKESQVNIPINIFGTY